MSHARERQELGPYTVGEIPRPIEVTFLEADGQAIDLSGFSADFVIQQVEGASADGLGAGAATVEDAATGLTRYLWTAADCAVAGRYRGQMWVGDGSNRLASIEFWWDVLELTPAPDL